MSDRFGDRCNISARRDDYIDDVFSAMLLSLLRRKTSATLFTCVRLANGELLRMKRISKKKDLIAKRSDAPASHVSEQTTAVADDVCSNHSPQ